MTDDYTVASGTASYTRIRRPAEFESQTPALTVNFEVVPGSNPEVVFAKVMGHLKGAVEGVFSTPTTRQDTSISPASHASTGRGRKHGSAPEAIAQPTADVAAKEPVAADDLSALVGEKEPEPVTPTDDLAALAGEPEPAEPTKTIKDVEHALMTASAHLRAEFGNINDIKKLLTAFNVGGYTSLKPEQFAEFIEKSKALLTLKKE